MTHDALPKDVCTAVFHNILHLKLFGIGSDDFIFLSGFRPPKITTGFWTGWMLWGVYLATLAIFLGGNSTFVTFLGWLSDLLERLSDLQPGDEQVHQLKPTTSNQSTRKVWSHRSQLIVGGWLNHPFEKYARSSNWKSSPRIGVKIPKIFEVSPP